MLVDQESRPFDAHVARPYMLRGTHTPYASATAWSTSESRAKPRPYFSVEGGQALGRVGADADDGRGADRARHVPQPARLGRNRACHAFG